MSMSNASETALLNLLFNNTDWANVGDAAGLQNSAEAGSFYVALQRAFPPTPQRAFAWFAAFDAPWRAADWHPVPGEHPEETHWGLFDAQRRPKPVVEVIPRLGGR